jgi:DNA-binding transcriptional regulator YiaG
MLGLALIMKKWKSQEIKKLRSCLGLTQTEFGVLLGVSENYIYLLESGRKCPGKTLKLLLNYIDRDNVRQID